MSLEDYERRGSWIMAGGKTCSLPGCSIHSANVTNIDVNVLEHHDVPFPKDADMDHGDSDDSDDTAIS